MTSKRQPEHWYERPKDAAEMLGVKNETHDALLKAAFDGSPHVMHVMHAVKLVRRGWMPAEAYAQTLLVLAEDYAQLHKQVTDYKTFHPDPIVILLPEERR